MVSSNFGLRTMRTVAVCLLFAVTSLCGSGKTNAQCPGTTLTGGLLGSSKLVQSNVGNLIVAETGTPAPNSGRVSIVGLDGSRRTLLEGA